MSAKSLHEASVDAAISGLKHIVISITPEGELVACGSSELVEAMIDDPTSKESLLETFSSSVDPALKLFVSTQVPFYRTTTSSCFFTAIYGFQASAINSCQSPV